MNLPSLIVRQFTDDQFILDKVSYSNSYQIKGFKTESDQPVVLDIGAHCGYFCFLAYAMGAKKIYAIEPYLPNFKMLLKNTESIPNIVQYNLGTYTSDDVFKFYDPIIEKNIFYNFSDVEVSDNNSDTHHICQVLSLSNLFANYILERVDILKISIGYAELDILESCHDLGNWAESICGQTRDITPERINEFKRKMLEKGYNEFYIAPDQDENSFTFVLSKTSISKHFNIKTRHEPDNKS